MGIGALVLAAGIAARPEPAAALDAASEGGVPLEVVLDIEWPRIGVVYRGQEPAPDLLAYLVHDPVAPGGALPPDAVLIGALSRSPSGAYRLVREGFDLDVYDVFDHAVIYSLGHGVVVESSHVSAPY